MPTVGKHWPSTAPRGDSVGRCDICGVNWRRSQMHRDRDGRMRCPDDAKGRGPTELAQANAAASRIGNRRGVGP